MIHIPQTNNQHKMVLHPTMYINCKKDSAKKVHHPYNYGSLQTKSWINRNKGKAIQYPTLWNRHGCSTEDTPDGNLDTENPKHMSNLPETTETKESNNQPSSKYEDNTG